MTLPGKSYAQSCLSEEPHSLITMVAVFGPSGFPRPSAALCDNVRHEAGGNRKKEVLVWHGEACKALSLSIINQTEYVAIHGDVTPKCLA